MNISRRTFGMLTAGAAAAGLLSAPGLSRAAAKVKLRYGTAFPASHPGVIRITEAAKAIATRSEGAMELQVYPNSQLGGEADMFTQVRGGALELLAGELAGGDRVEALDAGRHFAIGNAAHLERVQLAELGDLLEGQRGVLDQPDRSGLGHQRGL